MDPELNILTLAVQACAAVAEEISFSSNRDHTNEGDYNEVFVYEMKNLASSDFRRHFRMSKSNFEQLFQWLKCKCESSTKNIINLETKLLAVLWLLATPECYRAVALRFGMSRGTLHFDFLKIVDALQLNAKQFIYWPTNPQLTARSFSRHGFPGTVGAIDGCYICIKKPCIEGDSYVCRKGFPAVTLQGICDHKMRITSAYAGWPSSVNDARIFRNSPIFECIQNNVDAFCPENTHLIGDKAYPLKPWLMTPFRQTRQLRPHENNYNLKLSKTRVVIERCFALLKGRFRRLKYLDSEIKYIPATILACCVLHNICLDEESEDFIQEGLSEEDNDNTDWEVVEGRDTRISPEVEKRNRIAANLQMI